MEYKRKPPPPSVSCLTLAEDQNLFYARFDRQNTDPVLTPPPSTDQSPFLSIHEVMYIFCSINTRKAAGADGVLGRVLKDCAAEQADVLTSIFNTSLSCSLVPACFKAATIVPLPKQADVTSQRLQTCGTHLHFLQMSGETGHQSTSGLPYQLHKIHSNFHTGKTGRRRMPLPWCCTHCWSTWSIKIATDSSSLVV